jgi:uncharacterized membrane protein
VWFNFAHLFSISMIPLSTAWMATSRLAPQPVAFYAAVFFVVNATYLSLIWELMQEDPAGELASGVRRVMRIRATVTLCLFAAAALTALMYPLAGLGLCIVCLLVYLRPDPAGGRKQPAGK